MKKTTFIKLLSCVICIVLIAATALIATSCSGNFTEDPSEKENPDTKIKTELPSGEGDFDDNILGEGQKDFKFSATDLDGNEFRYHIYTEAETVGDALKEHGLIEGDEGTYGLYVKKVCGIEADYDKDQTYWMFCVEGEMAPLGVDMTEIENGTVYSFVVSK
ncbi:MAG: DUF4430 domain-containing protein [Clostridia bacterium]|nr:DUF4430 domain-containing protein [Clostridia bacterium]